MAATVACDVEAANSVSTSPAVAGSICEVAETIVTVQEDSEVEQALLRQDPKHVHEWLRQNSLIYGALIGIGVVMVQPFLTATTLDLAAKICVVAFSVAIPLLAALVLVNQQ
jgi:hypothetical protein